MESPIIISYLNDFIFCPASIYFGQLYEKSDIILFKEADQLNGLHAHEAVDNNRYSSKKEILQAIPVYCEKYNIVGKIDVFDVKKGVLTERKKKIKKIYDGYVFQLYAQYFALEEMGYVVKSLKFYSMEDNKAFYIEIPSNDILMFQKFENTVEQIRVFDLASFKQTNMEKCKHCIYEPACDRSLL